METWKDCPRKWAFDKIDNLPRSTNEAAELGTRCHTVLEDYLGKGLPVNLNTREGKIVFPSLKFLPLPMTPGLEIEQWFDFWMDNLHLRGRIDWRMLALEVPIIGDHKTTSAFHWAKTEQALLTDFQAGCYAYDAMLKTNSQNVQLQWTYMSTSGSPQAKAVKPVITRPHVEAILEQVYKQGQEMFVMRESFGSASTYPYNATACDKYGGCPYKQACGLTLQDSAKSVFSQMKAMALAEEGQLYPKNQEKSNMGMDILARLNAAKAAKAGEAPAAATPGAVGVNPPDRETASPEVLAAAKAAAAPQAAAPAASAEAKKPGDILGRIRKPNAAPAAAPAAQVAAPVAAPAAPTPAVPVHLPVVQAPVAPAIQATQEVVNAAIDQVIAETQLNDALAELVAEKLASKVIARIAAAFHMVNG